MIHHFTYFTLDLLPGLWFCITIIAHLYYILLYEYVCPDLFNQCSVVFILIISSSDKRMGFFSHLLPLLHVLNRIVY